MASIFFKVEELSENRLNRSTDKQQLDFIAVLDKSLLFSQKTVTLLFPQLMRLAVTPDNTTLSKGDRWLLSLCSVGR